MLEQLGKKSLCSEIFKKNGALFGLFPIGLLLTVSIQDIQRYSRFLFILSYQCLFSCGQIKKAMTILQL